MNLATYVGKAVALGFSAAVLPGPFQAYIISQALHLGWQRASLLPLAPLLSDGPVIIIAFLALGRVPDWGLDALQVAGGIFVLYLAWSAFRTARSDRDASGAQGADAARRLVRAATINLLSPTVYIYWATVSGPLLVRGWEIRPIIGLAFLAAFYGTMIVTTEGLALLVSHFGNLNAGLSRALILVSVAAMVVFSAVQITQGVQALLTGR